MLYGKYPKIAQLYIHWLHCSRRLRRRPKTQPDSYTSIFHLGQLYNQLNAMWAIGVCVSWWASNPLGACQVTLHFIFEHLLQSCLCLCCMLHQRIHYRKRIVLHETGETQKQFANTVSCCTFSFRLDIKVACDQSSWNATMQNDQTHYTFYDLMIEKLSMSDRSCASLSPSQA
jgi:hypothetical protein